MIKDSENKMQTNVSDKSVSKRDFFFPEHGVTVQAETTDQAEEELQKIIKTNKPTQDNG